MKKENILSFVSLLGMPVLLILLGLVLIVNPDSASALIARVLGWALCLTGVVFGLGALTGSTAGRMGKILAAVFSIACGVYLLTHPLVLATLFGRVVGIILACQGISDMITAAKSHKNALRFSPSFLLSAITTAIGIGLVVVPMNASRFLIVICGIVVLVVGLTQLADRLRGKPKKQIEDPNIIDAE